MSSEKTLDEISEELLEFIDEGKHTASWIGSGLSICAGYPGWKETVNELCSACDVEPMDLSEKDPDVFMEKAEKCKENDLVAYHKTLARLFGEPPTSEKRFAFDYIMKLPFKCYITTNFDPLLHQTAKLFGYNNLIEYPTILPAMLERYKKLICYLHGLARLDETITVEDLIITKSDFDAAYKEGGIISFFLLNLFTSFNVIFIGCSLNDEYIKETFRRTQKILEEIKLRGGTLLEHPKRYAILPKSYKESTDDRGEIKVVRDKTTEDFENKYFNNLGVEVRRYKPDDKHTQVDIILEKMCRLSDLLVSKGPIISIEGDIPDD